jgi:type 1 glutamine amidotransferase/HEAT repeat protein
MVFCLGLGLGPVCAAAPEAPIRVLLFSGQNNHDWRQTTPKIKSILSSGGRFTVEVTERPDQCQAETLARYDVILSDWNTWGDVKVREWPAETREAFLAFLRKGGGHVVVHAGGASFFDWPDYQKITGGSWGKNTGHGAIHAFEVKPVDPDHPITRGLEPFRITDELWHATDIRPGIKVLATAFSAREKGGSGRDEPVVFVTEFGAGRGLTLLLGHDAAAMEAPGFQALLRRGTEWAATGKVTITGLTEVSAADFDAALAAVMGYRFGDSRVSLARLERLVQAVSKEPATRKECALKLARVLGSDATTEAQQFACWQLSLIGSAAEVPALANRIADTNLSPFARQALERIPGDESLRALQAALAGTSGLIRIGVINSLAVRRSEGSVGEIARLIDGTDTGTAGAAIRALGEIGGLRAVDSLLATQAGLPASLQAPWAEALLRCAEQFLAADNRQAAAPLLERLVSAGQPAYLRLTAFPLYVSSLGERGAGLVIEALTGQDQALQAAATRALRTTSSAALVQAAAGRLDRLAPELQAPVIALLGERGEAVALPAVARAAASKDASVKRAAWAALGLLGDASTVPLLVSQLDGADNEEVKLLCDSMIRLRGGGVDETMVAELKKSQPAAQRSLARVLTARGQKAAIAGLIAVASSPDAQVRREAIAGLEKIGDVSACGPLLQLLDTPGETGPIESALAAICRREGTVDAVVAVLANAGTTKRTVLLGVLGAVGGDRALETVRAAVKAEDTDTRTAAVRALADWPDAAPLEDLVASATTTQDAKVKALALRGVARLAPQAKNRSPEQLVDLLGRALAVAAPGEQKALLGALGEVPSVPTLNAAVAQLQNPGLADEAGMAVLKIVEAIGQQHRAAAKAALAQVASLCKNPTIVERTATMSLKFGELYNLSVGATATNLDGLRPDGEGSWGPAAIDGNPSTYWDETDNQKLYVIQVQLKERSKVGFLRILGWQQHNYAPKDFEVLCDGKLARKVENARYKENWLMVDLPPTDCTTLTLKITGCYGASPAIRELEIYGKAADGQGQPPADHQSGFHWDQTETSLALVDHGQTVWRLNFDRRQGKPFFHPLALPGWPELTALRPADHPWHRAGWWSWKLINGLNYWEEDPKTGQSEGQSELLGVRCAPGPDGSARIEMELDYHPSQGGSVLKETRVLRAGPPDAAGSYRIDWTSTFVPTGQDVRLERTPIPGQPGGVSYGGYAGLSMRMAAVTRGWVFTSSEGVSGEQATHGKPARWLDFSGKDASGRAAGLALFDHPGNLRHPVPWYVSQGMPYFSPAVLFHEPYTLTAGRKLTLRYRVLVHAGLLNKEALDREWESFRQTQ